jgi:succinoglycan biosynthesis protein ExoV
VKLEYSRPDPLKNFGDDLNEWFWDEVCPGLVDEDDSTILLGMGTIFSRWFTDRLPANSRKIVLGSGGGKEGGPPVLDSSWSVYGVRGPLTASYSDLDPGLVLTDPAMLLRTLPAYAPAEKREGIGFMPHIWSDRNWDWRRSVEELGLVYISPRDDARETIRRIGGLRGLITEAMHGAIVADALRTPWLAVGISPKFESSKWCDWGGALGVPIHFHSIPALRGTSWPRLAVLMRANLKLYGDRFRGQSKAPAGRPSSNLEIAEMQYRMRDLMENGNFQLSDERRLDAAIERTVEAIQRLKRDKDAGKFEAKVA